MTDNTQTLEDLRRELMAKGEYQFAALVRWIEDNPTEGIPDPKEFVEVVQHILDTIDRQWSIWERLCIKCKARPKGPFADLCEICEEAEWQADRLKASQDDIEQEKTRGLMKFYDELNREK